MVDGMARRADGRPTAATQIHRIVDVATRLETGPLTKEEAWAQATEIRRAAVALANDIGEADDAMRSAAQVTATLSIRLEEGSPEQRCAEELARGLASSVDPPLELDFEALAAADAASDTDDDDDDEEEEGEDEDGEYDSSEDPGDESFVSGREWIEISHMNGSRTFALEVRSQTPDTGGNTILGTIVRTVTWGADDCEFSTAQSWLNGVRLVDLHTLPWEVPMGNSDNGGVPKKGDKRVR